MSHFQIYGVMDWVIKMDIIICCQRGGWIQGVWNNTSLMLHGLANQRRRKAEFQMTDFHCPSDQNQAAATIVNTKVQEGKRGRWGQVIQRIWAAIRSR